MKNKTYSVITFGCQMNEAESEQIEVWYQARGWEKAESWQEADEVIINSCSVRESAENRVFGLINNINKLKIENYNLEINDSRLKELKPRIILTGCMVGSGLGERKRYSLGELKKRLPQVAEFKPWWFWGFDKIKPFGTRKDTKKAFVPIMKGCDNFCSYCVVPYAKGKEVSLPFDEIICQVEELAERGWEHIVLLGQNVNSYGKKFSSSHLKKPAKNYHISIYEKKGIQAPFALLLRAIHPIKDIKKISFLTSNPWDLNDEIIEAMRWEKIDRYLHLPVQSGDDRILRKMNRPYTADQYLELVEKIRQEIPDIQIGTDIIVGFPGETKKAFQNTVELCSKVGFEKAYIAKYSPRPGTAAFKLEDNVPPDEKKRRWKILEDLINS